MITLARLSRTDIDAWPIEDSGLSIRVVNSSRKNGWKTVGDLRDRPSTEILALRSLGRVSLQEIQQFFACCEAIARGQKQFATLDEVLRMFLDDDEMDVLSARYGLRRPDLAASRNYVTLQRVGNETSRTRERVRQVEAAALLRLRSRLAHACLEPVVRIYDGWLRAYGGVLACAELAEYPDPDFLAPSNPCSVLLLLSDLFPGAVSFHRQFFCLLPEPALLTAEASALRGLRAQAQPVRVATLLGADPFPELADHPHLNPERMLEAILSQHPDVLTTRDHRHAVEEGGLPSLVQEAMRGLKLPAHFREITKALNTLLLPEKRRGSGFTLKTLGAMPRLSRPERGQYGLATGKDADNLARGKARA